MLPSSHTSSTCSPQTPSHYPLFISISHSFPDPCALPFHTGCYLTTAHCQSPFIAIPCHSFFHCHAIPCHAIHCHSLPIANTVPLLPFTANCHITPYHHPALHHVCVMAKPLHCVAHNSHHAQIQRMANATFDTRASSRHLCTHSQSLPCAESMRKHCHSRSPNQGYNHPPDCAERHTQDSSQHVR